MPKSHEFLTLCANELQARLLRAEYNRSQAASGRDAWQSPTILSLPRWVREQWLSTWPSTELISHSKERWLWLELIRADSASQLLLAPELLAEQMMRCWKLCQEWKLDVQSAPLWTAEQQLYARLSIAYEAELIQRGWVTEAQLGRAVFQSMSNDSAARFLSATDLRFHGFHQDNLCPRDRDLLHALGFRPPTDSTPNPSGKLRTARNPNDQWDCVAKDIQQLFNQQPEARVVVAIPQLHRHIDNLEVIWLPKLTPSSIKATPVEERPWVIEQPTRLPRYPAIAALLDLCQLAPHNMSFEVIARVLRQPLFFTAQERRQLSHIEGRLRSEGLIFNSADFIEHLNIAEDSPLAQRLQALKGVIDNEPRFASGHEWARHWRQRWQAFPFANSNDHWSLREDLFQALTVFSSLGDEMGAMGRTLALTTVQQVLQDHYHSPRQKRDVRIRICDATQADGLPCTHRFVTNLDAQNFPAQRPQPPWINPDVLTAARLPQASPVNWLQSQRRQLQRLCCNSPVHSLYRSQHDEQGTELLATPLLALDWPEPTADPKQTENLPALEWPQEAPLAALSPQRLNTQKGGSSLLRRQSASPFAAFVYHRLGCQELARIPQGLTADRQGQWVHAVLADFWTSTQSSEELALLSPEQVIDRLKARIDASATRFLPRHRYGDELQWLESDRVLRLCSRWVEHERKRVDRFEVLYCEQSFSTQRRGLALKLQLDRLDRVHTEFGPRYLVIDYKTGLAEPRDWRGTQIREPQLPLYATTPDLHSLQVPSIDGICFARVDENQPALLAATNWCQRLTQDEPGDKAWKYIWAEEIEAWQQQLDSLVEQYIQGETRHRASTDLTRDFGLAAAAFLVDQLLENDPTESHT